MQFFLDRGSPLGTHRRTPSGGVIIPANVARTGVMKYTDPKTGKVIRRYNPPEVVAAALPMMDDLPVTFNHPPERVVDAANFRRESRGHALRGSHKFENSVASSELLVNDGELLEQIEIKSATQVSLGYFASHDKTPGVTPEGDEYDERRLEIIPNHFAILRTGRAGPDIGLQLDGEEFDGVECDAGEQEQTVKIKLKIKGVVVECDAAEAQAHIDSLQGALDATDAQLAAAKSKVKEVDEKATNDAIEAEVEKRVAAKLSERDAESKRVALRAKISKHFPDVQLDGKSDDYLNAYAEQVEKIEKTGKTSTQTDAAEAASIDQGKRQPVTDGAAKKPFVSPRDAMVAKQRKPAAAAK